MPYSSESGKKFVDRALTRLIRHVPGVFFKHKKIIDLGAGSGTYYDRYSPLLPKSKFNWVGVEIWKPYIEKFQLHKKYSEVQVADVIEYLKRCEDKSADLCFVGDIAEHMTKEQSIVLMTEANRVADLVILSIPIVHYPQDEYEGNPYEKHVKDDWSHEEVMATFDHIFFYGVENEIGVYLCSTERAGILEQALKPMVAVYGITKNEEKFIERCYHSIEDADFVVFCDTGSTDQTFEKLSGLAYKRAEHLGIEEEFTIRHVDGVAVEAKLDRSMLVHRICVDPWRFDDARNTALSLVPICTDLCISIDADEMLQPGWRQIIDAAILEELHTTGQVKKRYNHRFKTIWNWALDDEPPITSEHWHERIHTRTGYTWKLPVHEVLQPDRTEEFGWLSEFWMVQQPDGGKERPYLAPLEQALKEDPTRWRLWYFYANDIFGIDNQKALDALQKAKECPDSDKAFIEMRMSNFKSQLGDRDGAIAEMWAATRTAPHVREYRVYLAQLLADGNDDDKLQAKNIIRGAVGIRVPTNGYEHNPSCWGENFEQIKERILR